MSFKCQFDSSLMDNPVKSNFSWGQICSEACPLPDLVYIIGSQSGISQFKSCFCGIQKDFTEPITNIPDITLGTDLSGARSWIDVFPDQKPGLCAEVKTVDKTIKTNHLQFVAPHILY